MPWSLTIERDADKNDVGLVSTIFTASGNEVFHHAERIRLTAGERNAFFARAYAARDAWRTRRAWETTNEAAAQTLMNNNDPNPNPA